MKYVCWNFSFQIGGGQFEVMSMHFAIFLVLRFSKHYSSHSFELISAKLYEDIDRYGEIQAGDLPIINRLMGLIFLNTGPYGAANFKHYSSYSLNSIFSGKRGEGTDCHGGLQAITFLGDLPVPFLQTGPYGAANFKTLLLQF